MRRSAAAAALTVVGLWLILSFKSSPVTGASPSPVAAATSSTVPPGPSDTSPPAAGAAPPGGGSTTTTSGSSGPRTVTGNTFSNRYGNVQVAVVLSGTRITDVKALQMPVDRSRSQEISLQAAPLLHDEVIQAQSARIDTIGGATYTSASYAQSLQSALDKARG